MTIKQAIDTVCTLHGWSLSKLSRELDCAYSTLLNARDGKAKPDGLWVGRLAEIAGVKLSEIDLKAVDTVDKQ